MKIVALQTARAGSKGVPNKNITPVYGVPMYQHNLIHASRCKSIEKVYISTDIFDANTQNYAKVLRRPKELCGDDSSHYDVILHGFTEIEKREGIVDVLVVLLGNNIDAKTADLTEAIQKFTDKHDDFDSCMSVSKYNMFNPYRSFELTTNGKVEPIFDHKVTNRSNVNDRNAFNDTYFFNGSFWIINRDSLLRNDGKSVYPWLGNRIMPYIQPEGVMEVDSAWQLDYLENSHGVI